MPELRSRANGRRSGGWGQVSEVWAATLDSLNGSIPHFKLRYSPIMAGARRARRRWLIAGALALDALRRKGPAEKIGKERGVRWRPPG